MGLLDFFKKRRAPAPEEKKEEVVIASPIDYSAVPFQLEQPLTTEDNRRVLNQCMDTMNRLLKLAGEKAEIPTDFAICSEDLIFTGVPCTCLEKCPNTKTGKVPRYIVILHFAAKPTSESEASDQYSGKIFFLQDGAPGKGFISCWKNENKIHATIHFGLKGSTLTVKKVEGLNNQDEMVVLYKDL